MNNKNPITGQLVSDKDILNSLNIIIPTEISKDLYVSIIPKEYNKITLSYINDFNPEYLISSFKRLGIIDAEKGFNGIAHNIFIPIIQNGKATNSLDILISNLEPSHERSSLEIIREFMRTSTPNITEGLQTKPAAIASIISQNEKRSR